MRRSVTRARPREPRPLRYRSGTVTGTPNTVSFQIGVSTTALTANEALAENNQKTAALEATLLKNGITQKNLRSLKSASKPAACRSVDAHLAGRIA